ncbi:Uncharacterised protein [Achromobacter xylosoxidans]|nr:Uncharacterised protein [Achromobacter xylosoxidans]
MFVTTTVTSSPWLTSIRLRLNIGATAIMYTRTLLPSRTTLAASSSVTPSFLAIWRASSHMGSSRFQTLTGWTLERCTRHMSCGSAKLGPSCTSFIVSPEMSMSWSFSGLSGPTFRKRSFENLFSDTSHLPSASRVSPMVEWLWPGW